MAVNSHLGEFNIATQISTNHQTPVRWIISHVRRNWFPMIIAIIGAFGNAALASIPPVLIGQAFTLLQQPEPDVRRLLQFAFIIAISQVVRAILQFGRGFGFELVAQRVERDIRSELYVNLLGKSMTFHSLQPVGDTMARATNDVREINYLFSPGLSLVIGSLNFIIWPLILAPRYSFQLMIAPALFIVFYLITLWQFLRQLEPITDKVRSSFGVLNSRLSEVLDGIETVKGAAQEKNEVRRFLTNAARYRDSAIQQGIVEARYLPMLVFNLTLALGLLHALILFRQGVIQLGDVVGYFGLLLILDFPTFISQFAYSQISLGLAGARRILELMNRVNDLDQNVSGYHQKMVGEISFEDVCFSYGDNEPSLEHIDFHVKPGQTVAIVGQTGSGKTSLTKLINRTFDVKCGSVKVDGVDVRDWNLEALRQNISIIEQDVFLFSKTVSENISFGKPEASQAEIENAAQLAQADEFIRQFSKGYQTVLGERGVTISGGQRQRLALARAFLTDPAILILDDSTSAIDSATEDLIQRAIFAAAHGRTTFIITHRLSQIRWADLIIVLRKGKIAAIGNHDELMAKSEAYNRIFSQ